MVGRLSWITKNSHGLGHVSIVINIWSFQLHQESCRSPYIGASEVPNRSGLELRNKTHTEIEREALKHTQITGATSWGLLGFAALGGLRGALVQPMLCHGPGGQGCSRDVSQQRVPSPSPWWELPAPLPRELPASQMLLLENLPACQLPKALTGCDLHPGREGGWEQEGHFITHQSG